MRLRSLESGIHNDDISYKRAGQLAEMAAFTNPRNTIEEAKDTSETSLLLCMALLQDIRRRTLPAEVIPEALEMFAMHIANGCPPGEVSCLAFQLAETSFSAIITSFVMFLVGMKDPPLGPVLRVWPSMLEMAKALIIHDTRASERLSKGFGEKWLLLGMFLEGIQKFRTCGELQKVAYTPEILELAVHIFVASDGTQNAFLQAPCMMYIELYISMTVMRNKGTPSSTLFKKALDDILSALHGQPELLVDPILSLLPTDGLDENARSQPSLACMHVLGRLSGLWSHPIAATVEERSLTHLTKVLGLLTNITPFKQQTNGFADHFTLCLGLFVAFSVPHSGPTWLLQALHYRIFNALCACNSWLAKAYEERVNALGFLLSVNLPAHLIDPSVIWACEHALSALSAGEHGQLIRGPLAEHWKSFVNRFFEQYVFYCYFDAVGHHGGCFKCGIVADGKKKTTLRKCGACKIVEYCSNDCQVADWKEQHKRECKLLKGKSYGPLPRYAKPLFKRRLAAYDARRHLPGLRAIASQRHPCFPLQCMCMRIDYGAFPPVVNVSLLKDAPVDHELLLKDALDAEIRERSFDDIRLHDGSSAVLCTLEFESRNNAVTRSQAFHWAPPYFASKYGTDCPDMYGRRSIVTPYVDEGHRELATTWSVVDEIAYRGNLSPQMILDSRLSDIRRKVHELIAREKARMQVPLEWG